MAKFKFNQGKVNKYQNPDFEKTVEIHDAIPSIETTVVIPFFYCYFRRGYEEYEAVVDWTRKIKEIYYSNKPNKRIVLGIQVESGRHYKNGENTQETKKKKAPLRLLQICVGYHCLFLYLPDPRDSSSHSSDDRLPKALRDLFTDDKTVVAAVGMGRLAEKLLEGYGLQIARPLDLNRVAALSKELAYDLYDGYNVVKLGKVVLGDEGFDWDEISNKMRGGSRSISWWSEEENATYGELSGEKVRSGTFESFLAHKMGMKFLKFVY